MTGTTYAPNEFFVTIEQIGNFRGDLWWAGCKAAPRLLNVQRTLRVNLRQAGFALEKRRYSQHITLGRQVATDATPWRIEPFGEEVDRGCLLTFGPRLQRISEYFNKKLAFQ
ncbi:MAG: hypothetical protein LBS84_12660 [Clostridiales bacterium]|jgi:2'-5' RNA ligase|nr:hypothetical protein [Clostridiales bacterium]